VSILALCNLFMAQHTDPGVVPLGARPLPVCSPVSSPPVSPNGSSHDKNGGSGIGIGSGTLGTENIDNGAIGISEIGRDDTADDDDGRSLLASTSAVGTGGSLGKGFTKKRRRGIRRCRKCQDNYKPPRAHHDSVTGRCIVKMDHFCPWVGNAVGALNHKFFFLFILYTFTTSLLSILLLMIRFVRCGYTVLVDGDDDDGGSEINPHVDNNNMTNSNVDDLILDYTNDNDNNSTRLLYLHQNQHFFSRFMDGSTDMDDYYEHRTFQYDGCETTYSLPVIVLLIMSVAFLFFTCCMLPEQIDAIETNMSKIARMKRRQGHADAHEYTRINQDFNEFFGGSSPNISLHWFLPLPVRFPPGRKDRVLGFEYRDAWYGEPYREEMDDDDDADDDGALEGGGHRVGNEEVRIGIREHGELELGDFSTHSNRKVSSLLAKEEELKLELPMGTDDIKLNKTNALKKRASTMSNNS